jgi:uncharacterized membrane protein
MDELFWGVLGLLAIILPVYFFIRNILKIRRLEDDVLELRGRIMSLECAQMLASGTTPESAANTGFAPHQLSTLIDLETLKNSAKEQNTVKDESTVKDEVRAAQEGMRDENSTQAAGTTPELDAPDLAPLPAAKTSREWEAFVGGRLFNRIGAAAIILGIGFFLKYAFDNDLIPEWMRVALGFLAGAGLIAGAVRAHKKSLEIFAQGLMGAGLGALYLSVYAAFNFYHLVPLTVAFGGMICVTALGFVLALRFESLAIALIAWFGGFITPLLFHTETPNAVGLFSYLLFLNLGLLALVFMRDTWFVLKPLSFCATYGIALLWYADTYTTLEHFGMATTFAVLYWAMFFGVDAYRAVSRLSRNDAVWRKFDSLLNGAVSYAALCWLVYDAARVWLPLLTILYGSVYFLASQAVRLRREPDEKLESIFAFKRYLVSAIFYLFLATSQQFSRETLIIAWSLEMVVLFFIGWRMKEKTVIATMLVVGCLLWGMFFLTNNLWASNGYWIEQTSVFVPLVFTAHFIIAASFFVCAVIYEQLASEFLAKNPVFLHVYNPYHYSWIWLTAQLIDYIWRVALKVNEINTYPLGLLDKYSVAGVYALIHIAFLLLLAYFGRRNNWRELTQWSLIVFLVFLIAIIRGFAYEPATAWVPVLNVRVVLLLASVGTCFGLSRLWNAENTTVPKFIHPHLPLILGATAFLLVFSLLTGEASDVWHSQIMSLYALPQGDTTLQRIAELEDGKQLTISLVWLAYAIALMALGLMRRLREVRLVALGLAGVAILKIFLYDLSSLTTPYRIGSFIGLGVVLMLVSYLYQRFKHIILDEA